MTTNFLPNLHKPEKFCKWKPTMTNSVFYNTEWESVTLINLMEIIASTAVRKLKLSKE